jgi:hypothetical protein
MQRIRLTMAAAAAIVLAFSMTTNVTVAMPLSTSSGVNAAINSANPLENVWCCRRGYGNRFGYRRGNGGRYFGGRYWAYGVGSCWRPAGPGAWVWICR